LNGFTASMAAFV